MSKFLDIFAICVIYLFVGTAILSIVGMIGFFIVNEPIFAGIPIFFGLFVWAMFRYDQIQLRKRRGGARK